MEQPTLPALAPTAMPENVELTNSEKLYPNLRMVHGMSKPENKVNPNGKPFVQGDMVVYPSRIKIADTATAFRAIFLRNTLEWANFEEVMMGGKSREEWRSDESRHSGNEDLPLTYSIDGKKMKRYRQITLYILIPEQVQLYLADVKNDEPMTRGFVSPVALKCRNFSSNFAKQLLDKVAGDEFKVRNAMRVQMGKEPIPSYVYEHTIGVEDFTNKAGNTFPILVYKNIGPVLDKEVLDYAAFAYKTIAMEKNLRTYDIEDAIEVSSGPKGVVRDAF